MATRSFDAGWAKPGSRSSGWEVVGGEHRPCARAVIIAYPHTTNWDLPFMLAVAYSIDCDVHWLGKKSLFRSPFGGFMRWVGGISVDRSRRTKLVDAVVDTIAPHEELMVVIPPEGTRSQAGRWKSGFYWVAVQAGVPIILGFLDYTRKRGGLGEVLHPTGDIDADFEKIRNFYDGIEGKYPDRQGVITLNDDVE